jgi:formate dehydrogenase subunit gamma
MQSVPAAISPDSAAVHAIIQSQKQRPGALLPILHGIQDLIGFIPADAVPMIAEELNLSRAEVHGVITYYHHFRQQPAGRHLVQICRAEACQARGAGALAEHAKAKLGCDFHHSTPDGEVTLEPAYCLGHCSVGPNIAIGDELHARVTPARFDSLIAGKRGEQ